jgi:hypothetical protein
MSKKVKLEFCLGVGMNQLFPEMVTIEFEPKKEDKSNDKFDYTILSYCVNDGETEPHGVMIQVDNGDTQYLTMGEVKTFIENREKL